jgi:hypothetical protein
MPKIMIYLSDSNVKTICWRNTFLVFKIFKHDEREKFLLDIHSFLSGIYGVKKFKFIIANASTSIFNKISHYSMRFFIHPLILAHE